MRMPSSSAEASRCTRATFISGPNSSRVEHDVDTVATLQSQNPNLKELSSSGLLPSSEDGEPDATAGDDDVAW
jgi:hypothetical protein